MTPILRSVGAVPLAAARHHVGVEGARVAVVVPTSQRPDRLRRMVAALEKQTLPVNEWEVVVVDDCSPDDTPEVLAGLTADTHLALRALRTDRKAGPAAARNLGWRSTTAEVVAFIDDDCVPSPEWLAGGLALFDGAAEIGIVQGRTRRATHDNPGGVRTVVREVLQPSPWFEGCNLFVRRRALEEAGGFDEGIGWFGEETAMGWSILDRGWRRGWAPVALVDHDVEYRPIGWHVRNHYLKGNLVRIASRHPAFRDTFWRRWAVEYADARFALAAVGVVAGVRWRPALVLTLPYVRSLPRPWSGPAARHEALFDALCHSASLAGKLSAGASCRTFVL